MKVVIGSKNKLKIQAVEEVFKLAFTDHELEFIGLDASSGVSDQPIGDTEIINGAKGRAKDARRKKPEADIWVGIEAGLDKLEDGYVSYSWVYILSNSKSGLGRTVGYMLPKEIDKMIDSGKELSEASNHVFNKIGISHTTGTVGILTNEMLDRLELMKPAVLTATIPFLYPELY